LETVHQDYAPKGVQFFYIYKALAHPEHNGYVTPLNLKERLLHVREAERTLGSNIPWICDSMENTLKHGLGNAPNSEYLIDPDGVILKRRAWSDPDALRSDLEALLGPVVSPTKVSDLNMPTEPPPSTVAKGIVPRIQRPSDPMQAVKVTARQNDKGQPFYVKLRAEATQDLLRRGRGQLYIGFFMDPLHHVHWNNLTDPLRYQLTLPEGFHATPASGSSAKVEHPADADPREFLIDLSCPPDQRQTPFQITIDYFACDDDDTFCVPVRQVFEVSLEAGRDGGRVMRRPDNPQGSRPNRRGRGNMPSWERMLERDSNQDGKLSRSEWPAPRLDFFERMDANQDGFVDETEMSDSISRFSPPNATPNQSGNRGNAPLWFNQFDTNRNRSIDLNELEQAPDLLRALDTNRDGTVSRTEFRVWMMARPD